MRRQLCLFVISIVLVVWSDLPVRALNDGEPSDPGLLDDNKVEPFGLNQKILIIYVQADDYRIPASDLANLNTTEDQEVSDFMDWFDETSWGQCTFSVTRKPAAGSNWYLLPDRYFEYSRSGSLGPMEYRDATEASSVNPTPPSSVTVAVRDPAGTETSQFDATKAGNYWYAVAGLKNGVESELTKIGSVANVTEGKVVEVTITKAAADDVDYFIVYRTRKDEPDLLENYFRIGYAEVTGTDNTYLDDGKSLDYLSNHVDLMIAAMTAADADVPDFEYYDAIIAIIYSGFLRGQAMGAYTFEINGQQFKIQTINQSSTTGFGRFCHEMGHWIGLPEQYDPVTAAARGYWTTMDGSNDRQYAGWEKDYGLGWIENPDYPSNIYYLERPGPGSPDFDQTIKVLPTELVETIADAYTTIKIKSSDTVHYYIEGRNEFAGFASDHGADKYIVVMESVDVWPPTIYPYRTLNNQKILSAGDPLYKPDDNTEITFTGTNTGPPETYNVHVKIKAEEQPDPKITPWSPPPWESVDIWVDSEREGGGWDDPATAVPKAGNGEAVWVNHVNRVYAKISNVGAAEAKDVQVNIRVNTPGGMGDAGTFVDLPDPAKVDIPANSAVNVYAEWTPTVDQHTCIEVEIEHLSGEKDIFNNYAQENITHFYSGTGSPWETVTIPLRVANPFEVPKKAYLEIDGLLPGWQAHFDEKIVTLGPEQYKTVNVAITPPAGADPCTKSELNVYAMMQLDDFIQPYGGITPIIHLADPIDFRRVSIKQAKKQEPGAEGLFFRAQGLTYPAVANKEIALILEKPDGRHRVHFTQTDGNGRFDTMFLADTPGEWRARFYYAGDDCHAPTESDEIEFHVRDGVIVPPDYSGWLSIHGGLALPRGTFSSRYDTGFHLFGDAGYRISKVLSVYIMGGINHFPGAQDFDSINIFNLNLNLHLTTSSAGALTSFVNAGPGYYLIDGSPNEVGYNIGAGLDYSISNTMAFEFGGNYHVINDPGNTQFFNIHIGLVFKF